MKSVSFPRQVELDVVTGLPPRKILDADLPILLRSMAGANLPLCSIMIDIDHFKIFNDTYGHDIGDCVLKHVSSLIRNAVKFKGEAYRYGGEEITVLMLNTTAKEGLATAERICRLVDSSSIDISHGGKNKVVSADIPADKKVPTGEQMVASKPADYEIEDPSKSKSVSVQISLGVASTEQKISGEELIVTSDLALYKAKDNGRNQAVLFDSKIRNEVTTLSIHVHFPGRSVIRGGSYVLLKSWYCKRDLTEIEAIEIKDPGNDSTDKVPSREVPQGSLIDAEIRGKVSNVVRRSDTFVDDADNIVRIDNHTDFEFEVKEDIVELMYKYISDTHRNRE